MLFKDFKERASGGEVTPLPQPKPEIKYEVLSMCCQAHLTRVGKLHYICDECKKDRTLYMMFVLNGQIKRKHLWLKPKE